MRPLKVLTVDSKCYLCSCSIWSHLPLENLFCCATGWVLSTITLMSVLVPPVIPSIYFLPIFRHCYICISIQNTAEQILFHLALNSASQAARFFLLSCNSPLPESIPFTSHVRQVHICKANLWLMLECLVRCTSLGWYLKLCSWRCIIKP